MPRCGCVGFGNTRTVARLGFTPVFFMMMRPHPPPHTLQATGFASHPSFFRVSICSAITFHEIADAPAAAAVPASSVRRDSPTPVLLSVLVSISNISRNRSFEGAFKCRQAFLYRGRASPVSLLTSQPDLIFLLKTDKSDILPDTVLEECRGWVREVSRNTKR